MNPIVWSPEIQTHNIYFCFFRLVFSLKAGVMNFSQTCNIFSMLLTRENGKNKPCCTIVKMLSCLFYCQKLSDQTVKFYANTHLHFFINQVNITPFKMKGINKLFLSRHKVTKMYRFPYVIVRLFVYYLARLNVLRHGK